MFRSPWSSSKLDAPVSTSEIKKHNQFVVVGTVGNYRTIPKEIFDALVALDRPTAPVPVPRKQARHKDKDKGKGRNRHRQRRTATMTNVTHIQPIILLAPNVFGKVSPRMQLRSKHDPHPQLKPKHPPSSLRWSHVYAGEDVDVEKDVAMDVDVDMERVEIGTCDQHQVKMRAKRNELLKESKEQTLQLQTKEANRLRRLQIEKVQKDMQKRVREQANCQATRSSKGSHGQRQTVPANLNLNHLLERGKASIPRSRASTTPPPPSPSPQTALGRPICTQTHKKRKAENVPTPLPPPQPQSSKFDGQPQLKKSKILVEAGEVEELKEWVILDWMRNNPAMDDVGIK
ncbi:hypothetical protein D9758_006176 [Tetrapyrgos nigripes]|uniref:Uncharacterized protein n=1 Tax=Tetrapyrgos nigripes TaxID=182062 RepID=A0A8H5GAW3_9AGAR|nr:hypothetical protein D9758_006176 [Tetrapyrgos nigripes]